VIAAVADIAGIAVIARDRQNQLTAGGAEKTGGTYRGFAQMGAYQ
jgi:hypothetical protein